MQNKYYDITFNYRSLERCYYYIDCLPLYFLSQINIISNQEKYFMKYFYFLQGYLCLLLNNYLFKKEKKNWNVCSHAIVNMCNAKSYIIYSLIDLIALYNNQVLCP